MPVLFYFPVFTPLPLPSMMPQTVSENSPSISNPLHGDFTIYADL